MPLRPRLRPGPLWGTSQATALSIPLSWIRWPIRSREEGKGREKWRGREERKEGERKGKGPRTGKRRKDGGGQGRKKSLLCLASSSQNSRFATGIIQGRRQVLDLTVYGDKTGKTEASVISSCGVAPAALQLIRLWPNARRFRYSGAVLKYSQYLSWIRADSIHSSSSSTRPAARQAVSHRVILSVCVYQANNALIHSRICRRTINTGRTWCNYVWAIVYVWPATISLLVCAVSWLALSKALYGCRVQTL